MSGTTGAGISKQAEFVVVEPPLGVSKQAEFVVLQPPVGVSKQAEFVVLQTPPPRPQLLNILCGG